MLRHMFEVMSTRFHAATYRRLWPWSTASSIVVGSSLKPLKASSATRNTRYVPTDLN